MPAANTKIGKYDIQAELGHGAFGRVYRAIDPTVGRAVAIKVLTVEDAGELLGRFRAEASTLAKLQHGNIVTIYELGEHEGSLFIAMELLEGENLQKVLDQLEGKKRSLSMLEKAGIMYQVAEGLRYAHQNGVVHRDIKPANIMLLPDGKVKIMDFGIAKVTEEAATKRTRQGDLVGTIMYMSPERLAGGEADSLTDIFSFGVVLYEFLAEKHPFKSNEAGSTIFRILSAIDPPPLTHCPPALELVVRKAMAKDREMRFQSMDDVVFDIHPILLELRRDRAISILADIPPLVLKGHLETAQNMIRQVLQLDPTNEEARKLRESLQQESQRRLLKARVDTLVKQGEALSAQRRYTDAIQSFESALRLDSSNPEIQKRVNEAKSGLEGVRQASRLISEARFQAKEDPVEALRIVATALKADPQNPDALTLQKELRQRISALESVQRQEAAILQAEQRRRQADFAGALSILAKIEAEQKGIPAVAELRSLIEAEQAEALDRERKLRLQFGIELAQEALRRRLLLKAVEILEELRQEFPEDPTAAELLGSVRQQLAAWQRAESLEKLKQEASDLLKAKRFEEASRLLQSGLKTFPGDGAIQHLLDTVLSLQASHERASAVAHVLDLAQEHRQSGALDQALQVITSALAQYPGETALIDLQQQCELELRERRRAALLQMVLDEGRRLLDDGRADEADLLLTEAKADFPMDASLEAMLVSAKQIRADRQEQQSVEKLLASVKDLEDGKRWQEALQEVERSLRNHPKNPKLTAAHERLTQNLRRPGQHENLLRHRRQIETALNAQDWPRATAALWAARQEFPEELVFAELRDKLRQQMYRFELDELVRRVRRSLAEDDLDEAARQLAGVEPEFSQDSVWQALQRELQARRSDLEALREAEERRAKGDFKGAEEVLLQAVAQSPLDERVAAMLRQVSAERAAKERDEAIAQGQREAEKMLAKGDVSGAHLLLERLCQQYPEDAGLARSRTSVQRRVEEERRQAERRQNLIRHRRLIEGALDARDWSRASEGLRVAQQQFPEEEVFRELETKLRRLKSEFDLESLVARVQESFAGDDLDGAATQLASSMAEFSQESLWQTLQGELKRRGSYREALREAEERRERGDYKGAEESLHRAVGENPVDQRAAAMLRDVSAERLRKEREEAVGRGRREAEGLREKGDLSGALLLLERLCRLYPEDTGLVQYRASVQQRVDEERRQADRRQYLLRCCHRIDDALEARDWSGAEDLLRSAEKEFPEEEVLDKLQQKFRKQKYEFDLEALVARVQECFAGDDLEGAATQLANAQTEFSQDTLWRTLQGELQRRRSHRGALREAEERRWRGDYKGAEEILVRAVGENPLDQQASAMLREVSAERLRKEREEGIGRGRRETEDLIERGDRARALLLLERLCRQYPEDAGLEQYRASVQQQIECERRQAMEQSAAADPVSPPVTDEADTVPTQLPAATSKLLPVNRPLYLRPAALVAVGILLLLGGYLLFRSSPQPASIARSPEPPSSMAVQPRPAKILFSYKVGDPVPDPKEIIWHNPGLPFDVVSGPSVIVQPQHGDKLERLTVKININGLRPGTYNETITVIPRTTAPVTGVLTVPVRVEVSAEPAKPSPEASKPVLTDLQLSPEALEFQYQVDGVLPDPARISVLQGKVEAVRVDPSQPSWLHIERAGNAITLSVRPSAVTAGRHTTQLVVQGQGTKANQRVVPVTLTVSPSPPGLRSATVPPIPPVYKGALKGTIVWSGDPLPPGGELILSKNGESVVSGGGKLCCDELPPVPLKTTVNTRGVALEIVPSGFRLRNIGPSPVTRISITWQVVR